MLRGIVREQPQGIILYSYQRAVLCKLLYFTNCTFIGKAHLCKITVINVILLFIGGGKKFVNSSVNSKINGRICNYLLFKSGKAAITYTVLLKPQVLTAHSTHAHFKTFNWKDSEVCYFQKFLAPMRVHGVAYCNLSDSSTITQNVEITWTKIFR